MVTCEIVSRARIIQVTIPMGVEPGDMFIMHYYVFPHGQDGTGELSLGPVTSIESLVPPSR